MTFTDLLDLAAERLGGAVLWANDDFFAPKENLLGPEKPVFKEGLYTERGKWMDGWESRRRREPGHDSCLVRLGLPGKIHGFVVDTAFFKGNYPAECSIEGCSARPDASPEELLAEATRWLEILPKSALRGDSQNLFEVKPSSRITHLRFHIYPDGGVARLRVHGEPVLDARVLRPGAEIDLLAAENGGRVLAVSDDFFGNRQNLLMPGRAPNMGDGWETRRSRGPHEDWALLQLFVEGTLRQIEVDTNHFKGNYPESCRIEGCRAPGASIEDLGKSDWVEVLPRTKLQPHTRHYYDEALRARGPFTHLRMTIYPDGGVSRLRVLGTPAKDAAASLRVARLDALLPEEAERELLACCGSTNWAKAMAAKRPLGSVATAHAIADRILDSLADSDWLEAFRAHPRIGEKKAERETGAHAKTWSEGEQAGTRGAAEQTMAELAKLNREYDAKFGHVFLICATGKSADEILASLRSRIDQSPASELRTAAEEQRKITHLRLDKLLNPS